MDPVPQIELHEDSAHWVWYDSISPRLTAALLALFPPLVFLIATVTSLGSALRPLAWARALAAQRTTRPGTPEQEMHGSPSRAGVAVR